jgi:hypothetical protein
MKKAILALAICATIVSCQKKEDTDPIDVSKTTYLMDGGWKLKFSTWRPDINDSASFPIDVYEPIPGCEKDNFYKFNTTNRVSLHEGGSKCVQTNPDSTVYGYVLTQNDSHLEIYTDPDAPNHSIVLAGNVIYPRIDSFSVTYTAPHPTDSTKTSQYVKAYVKQN